MKLRFYILHDLPGRVRIHVPALQDKTSYKEIEKMFSSIKGIHTVRIEPIIFTMLIQYDKDKLSRENLLRNLSLFFHQTQFNPIDWIMMNIKPRLRKDLFRSLVSGGILFFAFIRKTNVKRPDILDYIAGISTSYTVLSHGTNKLSHPDVLTGIISLFSLGASNMLQVSIVTWAVNALELLNDFRRGNQLSHIN